MLALELELEKSIQLRHYLVPEQVYYKGAWAPQSRKGLRYVAASVEQMRYTAHRFDENPIELAPMLGYRDLQDLRAKRL